MIDGKQDYKLLQNAIFFQVPFNPFTGKTTLYIHYIPSAKLTFNQENMHVHFNIQQILYLDG